MRTSRPGAVLLPAAALLCAAAWTGGAEAQIYADLECPCRAEASGLTSVQLTFGVRNFRTTRDSGPIRGVLEGRPAGGEDDEWERLATAHLPAADIDSVLEARSYTAAFRHPDESGRYELRLLLFAEGSFRQDSIYWITETVELSPGGGSFSSVYFDGAPTISLAGGEATLNLPAIRSAGGGTRVSGVAVSLAGAGGLRFERDAETVARHAFDRDLAPGGEIAATEVRVAADSAESFDYLQLRIEDGEGNVLAYETVKAPGGETLPARNFSTEDASLLADSDSDGVGDANERLMDTDPGDPASTPGDPVIDVLALYSPGVARLYDGDPSTRISHTVTLADSIFRDSNAGARLRLVGIAEAPLDEDELFSEVDADTAREMMDRHGADVGVMFRPFVEGSDVCGWAYLAGFRARGTRLAATPNQRIVHVLGDCGATTTAHEIGHAMGLGHSYAQRSSGAWRWARGHGIRFEFVTVMAYRRSYGLAPQLDRFADPDKECGGWWCGIDEKRVDGADAVKALRATRFRVSAFAEEQPDSDGDGFVDPVDAFPDDPDERLDSDGDGVGDNADTDDDNDGVGDASDAFPTDPAEWRDSDGDGVGDNADDFPADRFETADSDGDGLGDNADAFPNDPRETVDTDNDGVGNNADAFPFDTREWLDTDGDGTGDNADEDADNDGVADAFDPFPADAARSAIRSHRFLLPGPAGGTRRVAPAGDIDGDGKGDFLVGLTNHDGGADTFSSAAYLVASAGLAAADAADGAADRSITLAGVADRAGSWRFSGEAGGDRAGHSVAPAGDLDGDGRPEFIIGAPAHGAAGATAGTGAAYVVSAADLTAADAADGASDGDVSLANIAARTRSWKLLGEAAGDRAGAGVAGGRDIDGDGRPELVVGAPGHGDGAGAAYVLSAARLGAADAADGAEDGVISLAGAAALAGSWKLTGQDASGAVGGVAPVPYAEPDGGTGLLVASQGYTNGDGDAIGAVYRVAAGDLAAADAADGASDGVVALGRVAAGPDSWQFLGTPAHPMHGAAHLGDIDGDDLADLFIESGGAALLVSGADLQRLDGDDGAEDGVISPHGLDAPNSWEAEGHEPLGSPAAAGNLDGDALADLALLSEPGAWLLSGADLAARAGESGLALADIPTPGNSWEAETAGADAHGVLEMGLAGDFDGDGLDDAMMFTENGDAYLLASADLSALDKADAETDGRLALLAWLADFDGDGIGNLTDEDDDNDGYRDFEDRFPHDPGDWADSDGDGAGNNADAFPADADEQLDTDNDGIGDNADTDDDNDSTPDGEDSHPLDTDNDGAGNALDPDDDGDGVADRADRFPLNAEEWADSDRDGVGDNADTDDDNDGTPDTEDALPLDPGEQADTDGDGTGDNTDAFPTNAGEWADTDGDGTGNNADGDDDGDGASDADDAFPLDPAESADGDGDGVGDNADAFPMDAGEWADTDGDGTGNNADTDDDGDAHTDAADAFPLDAGRTRLFHYRLSGGNPRALAGYALDAGDIDGDGRDEALIGAPGTTPHLSPVRTYGAVYALSPGDLDGADRADGVSDGAAELRHVSTQPASRAVTGWAPNHLAGTSVSILGDVNNDGQAEWLAGSPGALTNRGAAYLVSPPDLDAADAANGTDGIASLRNVYGRPDSLLFLGRSSGSRAGRSVASAGDTSLDTRNDVLIGAPRQGGSRQGAAYLVSTLELTAADAADGAVGGAINLSLINPRADSWVFRGENSPGQAGWMVGAAGDIDGDGGGDIFIGAPYMYDGDEERGALYLIASGDLNEADAADGVPDSDIELARVAGQPNSWKLVGEAEANFAGLAAATADIDGDGGAELIVGAPGHAQGAGAVYVLPLDRLHEADSADGTSDHVVRLGGVAALTGAYRLVGDNGDNGTFGDGSGAGRALAAADIDGDGKADLLVGAQDYMRGGVWCPSPGEQSQTGAAYLLAGADFPAADAADGVTDGSIRLSNVAAQRNSWQLTGRAGDRLGTSISVSGDLDGDGRADLVLGAPWQFRPEGACGETSAEGVAVLISSADLPAADRRDGSADGVVDFEALRKTALATDFDFDGEENDLDTDDDNDGAPDADDAFPLDPRESADHDNDGIGDNADADDDNDGAPDADDAFPLDPYETADFDGDGIGDNADTDDDNDGTEDLSDAFPFDAAETADSDGDGIGDSADRNPRQAAAIDTDRDGIPDSEDGDDDNDGTADADDLFPLDASRSDLYYYAIAGRARALDGADFDFDGRDDLAVSIPDDETLLLASRDLVDADADDGAGDRVIDLDRDTVPAHSWKLEDAEYGSVFPLRDIDRDLRGDWMVRDLVLSTSRLVAEDSAFGRSDRVLRPDSNSALRSRIWRLSGSGFVPGAYSLADLDGDGREELLIGAPRQPSGGTRRNTAAYVASGTSWTSARSSISLDGLAALEGSWKVRSAVDIALGAGIAAAGDVDSDGYADLAIGAPDLAYGANPDSGGVFVLSGSALNTLDGTGGAGDGVIEITQNARTGIYRIAGGDFDIGRSVRAAGDVDGDGRSDLLVGALTGVYLIAGADLVASGGQIELDSGADLARSWSFAEIEGALGPGDVDGDGLSDVLLLGEADAWLVSGRDLDGLAGTSALDLETAALPAHSWRLRFETGQLAFRDEAYSADIDGDGRPELVLQAQAAGSGAHTSYILATAELPVLDSLDGKTDHVIHLDSIANRRPAD